MKELIRRAISRIPVGLVERCLAYSIGFERFSSLAECANFANREALWDYCLKTAGDNAPITYIEFGVWQGYSIRHFAEKNKNASSRFIGLDSFEGLPEAWAHLDKSHFSTGGNIPATNDSRISFIKGWFQNTSAELRERVGDNRPNLIVHYDADLYSSTLFCLTQMDNLKQSYLAIFDEFPGHETRALYNYLQYSLAKVEFLGKTVGKFGRPVQVLCRIEPH